MQTKNLPLLKYSTMDMYYSCVTNLVIHVCPVYILDSNFTVFHVFTAMSYLCLIFCMHVICLYTCVYWSVSIWKLIEYLVYHLNTGQNKQCVFFSPVSNAFVGAPGFRAGLLINLIKWLSIRLFHRGGKTTEHGKRESLNLTTFYSLYMELISDWYRTGIFLYHSFIFHD